jgi:hypothetical protein
MRSAVSKSAVSVDNPYASHSVHSCSNGGLSTSDNYGIDSSSSMTRPSSIGSGKAASSRP